MVIWDHVILCGNIAIINVKKISLKTTSFYEEF